MSKHALYATCETPSGLALTFRLGQPVDWRTASDRWSRLDDKRHAGRSFAIRWMRRRYSVRFFEVRAVDENGRGLGSDRHSLAFPVPFRLCRVGK
jgi:hypothetical protein